MSATNHLSVNTNIQLARATSSHAVLIVPGLNNSDEKHWQSLWETRLPNSERINLDDWATPDLQKWQRAIRRSLDAATRPMIIVAHSFGALASASIAAEYPDKIVALFLVAPADPDKFSIAQQLPHQSLPTTSIIIASSNDPWMSDSKAAYWALRWGSDFLRLRDVGHINSDSHLGYWAEGINELRQLVRKAGRRQRRLLTGAHKAA